MWGADKKKEIQSDYFKGVSFFSFSFKSLYGAFIQSVGKINLDINHLKVPKIIVIGCESSGKSSLLENIVKCQLFPKNATFGTKQPIHLILKPVYDEKDISYKLSYLNTIIKTNKNNIYKEIDKIMSETKDDIVEHEILIEINEINMINFEFYDLPGIRAYPPDLELKTKNLAKKYLSQENIIPICVIPVTTPRITSYVPLALIKEFKKEKQTLLCLTMCDRLQSENIEDLLINRIANNTDEYTSTDFAGITAVINRSHRNVVSLSDNDNIETKWFKENIYDNIPKGFKKSKLILENTRIGNLIENLDKIYNSFMKTHWIPNTMAKINNDIQCKTKDLNNIGFDPQLNEEHKKEFEIFIRDIFIKSLFRNVLNNDIELKNQTNIQNNGNNFVENMKIEINLQKINVLLDQLLENGLKCIDTLKPKRFWKFYNELIIFINKYYNDSVILDYSQYKSFLNYDSLSLPEDQYKSKLKLFCSNIKFNSCVEMYTSLLENFKTFKSFEKLQEDTESADLRIKLQEDIANLKDSVNKIDMLKEIK